MSGNDAVRDELFTMLCESNARDRVLDLVLAAVDGGDTFDEVVAGEPIARPGTTGSAGAVVGKAVEASGVFLSSITVEGFRGIGPASTLVFPPGPGLTIINGRNGSGKSSFAEALEVVLTGTAHRFARSAVWKDGWRNTQSTTPACIRLGVHLPGSRGETVIEQRWATDDLGRGVTTVQRPGEQRVPYADLGWQGPLGLLRPFLTHAELEAFLDATPTVLHDKVGVALGLEAVDAAVVRLSTARKRQGDAAKASKAAKIALIAALGAADDERAERARILLSVRKEIDLAALHLLAAGASVVDPNVAKLQQLAAMATVDLTHVAELAAGMKAAAGALGEVETPQNRQASAIADLLLRALNAHDHRSDDTCPVCGTPAVFDDGWRALAELRREDLRAASGALESASNAVRAATAAAQVSCQRSAAVMIDIDEVEIGPLREAWLAWVRILGSGEVEAATLPEAADQYEAQAHVVSTALGRVVAEAAAALDRRSVAWQSVAAPLLRWVEEAQAIRDDAGLTDDLEAAESWLKHAMVTLRNGRLDPIRNRARELWEMLRQQSNVSLSDIRFEGTANRRKVTFDVLVDDSATQALGVMSQGELNALALAVFLPRATHADSPFRFVVIDDPVQAMDPAKVDGMARVFAEIAKDRQVIVFSHDERLVASVEALGISATVLGVERDPGSVVRVQPVSSVTARLIADARALRYDEAAPDAIKCRVVPNLCRQAVEAAFARRYRSDQIVTGGQHAEVEAALNAASGLHALATLALLGDPDRSADLYGHLRAPGRYRVGTLDAFKAIKDSGHLGATDVAKLPDLLKAAEQLIEQVGR